MKLTPVVNFINILGMHFLYKSTFLVTKFCTKLAFGFEILAPKILYEKCAREMLMKLTTGDPIL